MFNKGLVTLLVVMLLGAMAIPGVFAQSSNEVGQPAQETAIPTDIIDTDDEPTEETAEATGEAVEETADVTSEPAEETAEVTAETIEETAESNR
ncbi:MAG: hypothetical protein HC893_14485 [Chloroflexaceae bacterium]|nr:hypothetical protein [Chloroflexaceae bacterium]